MSTNPSASGPFDSPSLLGGVRVLELSTRVSGAYCGMLLSLMGADVTCIEAPLTIDCPPEFQRDVEHSFHHGKRRVPYDAERLQALLDEADVLVVDSLHDDGADGEWASRSRALARQAPLRLPVIDLAADRSGEGKAGETPATAFTANAAGGMMWAVGHPGREPLAEPYDLVDYFAGAQGAGAAALSVLMRNSGFTGLLAWDIASADAIAYYTGQITSNFIPYERPWMRDGARATKSGGFYPAALYPTKDGYITLVCRAPREWAALREAMGNPEWSRRPEFQDGRIVARDHADQADAYLSEWTSSHTSAAIAEIAERYKVPYALILRPDEVLQVPQFVEHGLFVPDRRGHATVPGRPWRIVEPPQTSKPAKPPALAPTAGKPLAGLRVLDLTWVWAGPMTTAGLAELGAEVIKVESSARPDSSRLRGAAVRGGVPVPGPEGETSPYFNQMNRGKRAITVNIATEEGAELIRCLAAECDVVIENMRPGALARRGLDYASLAERNPGIIMMSMSMMGHSGPMSSLGGYGPVMSGLAGLDAITGYGPDDLIGNFNPSLGDPNGADHATPLLIAALVHRGVTGRGVWLDLSLIEALVSIMRVPLAIAGAGAPVPVPANRHAVFAPHGAFRCAGDDAWVAVAVRTDRERARLAELLGATESSPEVLQPALERWALERSDRSAEAALRGAKIPAARVAGIESLMDSSWARRRELWHEYDHPYLGPQKLFGIPWKLNVRGFAAELPAPLLGADTESVLVDQFTLIDAAKLQSLKARQVIS